MPRVPRRFWRRRRGWCEGDSRLTLQAVQYSLEDAQLWWCTKCGGTTIAGRYQPPFGPQDALDARRAYVSIPQFDTPRQRAFREFLAHSSANDHESVGSAA